MTVEVLVPELGESVLEATVTSWLKKEGEFVNVGDVLVELETDKVNLEVGAKSPGKLTTIKVQEGEDVKVGEVLALIDEKVGEPAGLEVPVSEKTLEKEIIGRNGGGVQERQAVPQVTPVASRMAKEKGVDVSEITGTGGEGRVTRADVEDFLQGKDKAEEKKKQPPGERRGGSCEVRARCLYLHVPKSESA